MLSESKTKETNIGYKIWNLTEKSVVEEERALLKFDCKITNNNKFNPYNIRVGHLQDSEAQEVELCIPLLEQYVHCRNRV